MNYPRLNPIGGGLNPHLWNKTHTSQNHFNGLSYDKIKKEHGLRGVNVIDSPELKTNQPMHPFVLRNLGEEEFLVYCLIKTSLVLRTHNMIQQ